MSWAVVVMFWIGINARPTDAADAVTSQGLMSQYSDPGATSRYGVPMSDEERLRLEEETRREILRVSENDPANVSLRFGKFAEVVLLPSIVLMILIVLVRRGSGGCM